MCPLQTIMLSALVGCDSPLQIVMAVWHIFLQMKCAKQLLLSAAGSHAWPSKLKILKKCAKRSLLSAKGCHIQLDGQKCPLRTYRAGFFQRAEKPSEDINSRLFRVKKVMHFYFYSTGDWELARPPRCVRLECPPPSPPERGELQAHQGPYRHGSLHSTVANLV